MSLGASTNLTTKVVGLVVAVSTISLLTACAAFVWYDRTSYAESKRRTLYVLAESIAGASAGPTAFQDPGSAGYVLNTLDSEPTAESAAIYMGDGTKLTEWVHTGHESSAPDRIEPTESSSVFAEHYLAITVPIEAEGQRVGTLRLIFSTADIDQRTMRFVGIAATVLILAMLLAGGIGMRLHRLVTDPIRELSSTTERVRRDQDYAVRARKMSNDELGTLTDGLNEMLAGIQQRDVELAQHREGLESLVESRTRDLDERNTAMRLVLDQVDEALVTIDRAGVLSQERSKRFDDWFGSPAEGETLSAHFANLAPQFAGFFGVAWDEVVNGFLPVEVNIAQLPTQLTLADRSFELEYRVIGDDDDLRGALVAITDVTAKLRQERAEAEQRELVVALERIIANRAGFEEFREETSAFLEIVEGSDRGVELKRALHTLKGNAPAWGLQRLATLCHRLEDQLDEEGALGAEDRASVRQKWSALMDRVERIVGQSGDLIEIPKADYFRLVESLEGGEDPAKIAAILRAFTLERARTRFETLAERTVALAERLGKGGLRVAIEDDGIRLPREQLAPIWSTVVHVLRNAVDHGIELPEQRTEQGKPEHGTIALRAKMQEETLVLEIQDDGRGIDWDRVRDKARSLGLAWERHSQLPKALFADGLSTRESVSETSGRGVGMGAFGSAVEGLGGTVEISSTPNAGTLIRVKLPGIAGKHLLM